jgi:hypothetical protein
LQATGESLFIHVIPALSVTDDPFGITRSCGLVIVLSPGDVVLAYLNN